MKSTLKFALVVVSFAFLTACGGEPKSETPPVDSTATTTETPAPTETMPADTTATTDTTKKAQ